MKKPTDDGVAFLVMGKDEPRQAAARAEDQALVARAQTGDRRAFGQLVERHQRRVYALAFGLLRQREDAWDVAQETFVRAYRHLDRFEGSSAFYTWVYRIAYNLSIDLLRQKSRRRGVELKPERLEETSEVDGCGVVAKPDEAATRQELSAVLHRAMMRLTEKHRAIIVLREVEGLSYEEMAEVLSISKGTVMSRLFHARQNLKALLEPYVEAGEQVPDDFRLRLVDAGVAR